MVLSGIPLRSDYDRNGKVGSEWRPALILELKHQLNLTRALGFDQRPESAGVIGTDAQPVGMVQEVERFCTKLNAGAFIVDQNCFHQPQIDGNGPGRDEAVSPEACRTRRNGIGTCQVSIRRYQPVQGPPASERENRGQRYSVEALPQPARSGFQVLNRQIEQATGGYPVFLMLT